MRKIKRPQRIEDLRQHVCLRLRRSNGSIAPWSFVSGNKSVDTIVAGPFIANDFPTMLGAAVEGLGLLSRQPANHAEIASLHRSCEEPFGRHQKTEFILPGHAADRARGVDAGQAAIPLIWS